MYPSHRIRYFFLVVLAIFNPYKFRLLSKIFVSGEFRYLAAVSHNTAAKTDHTIIDIHDRKNNPVPELIIHSMPFIHVEQSRFTEPLITVSFGFEVFIQAAAKLVRITKPKFPHRLFTQLTPCEVFMSLPAAFCTELIIIILRRLLLISRSSAFCSAFLSLLWNIQSLEVLLPLCPQDALTLLRTNNFHIP